MQRQGVQRTFTIQAILARMNYTFKPRPFLCSLPYPMEFDRSTVKSGHSLSLSLPHFIKWIHSNFLY